MNSAVLTVCKEFVNTIKGRVKVRKTIILKETVFIEEYCAFHVVDDGFSCSHP